MGCHMMYAIKNLFFMQGGLLQGLLLDIVEHMMRLVNFTKVFSNLFISSSDTYGNSSEIWKEYKVKIKTQLICKTY